MAKIYMLIDDVEDGDVSVKLSGDFDFDEALAVNGDMTSAQLMVMAAVKAIVEVNNQVKESTGVGMLRMTHFKLDGTEV